MATIPNFELSVQISIVLWRPLLPAVGTLQMNRHGMRPPFMASRSGSALCLASLATPGVKPQEAMPKGNQGVFVQGSWPLEKEQLHG